MQERLGQSHEGESSSLLGSDLDFVVRVVAPEFKDKEKLKELIRADRSFRKGLIGDEKLFRRVASDDQSITKISPALFFEILLRRSAVELENTSYLMESAGSQSVPVFYSRKAASFLASESTLHYLANMLSSFTRTESFVIPLRVRKGIWRGIRFSDMDIDSLLRLCSLVNEENRFPFYKRIADLCLFIVGIFPQYTYLDYRYPSSKKARPKIAGRPGRSAEDYEEEGVTFYGLAREHKRARLLGLEEPLYELGQNFNLARGCLNFLSEHHLRFRRDRLFNAGKT